MALVINFNELSQLSLSGLSVTQSKLLTNVERLSTGLRINRAKDDPAGLAVREKLRSDIVSYSQGLKNIQMGISMMQTADGALSIIDEKLIRMKELAQQSATGTYTNAQRLIINSEFLQMATEIDRIAEETNFNSIKLLQGDLSAEGLYASQGGWETPSGGGSVPIHFGLGTDREADYYEVSIEDMRTSALGLSSGEVAVSSIESAQNALNRIDSAISIKDNQRGYIGSLINRLEGTYRSIESNKFSLAAAESQISDADMAEEIASFISNRVRMEAAIAMLAQANVMSSYALKLLDYS